jgi:hypothetical protein
MLGDVSMMTQEEIAELAKDLRFMAQTWNDNRNLNKAADALKQQAREIAALRQQRDYNAASVDKTADMLEACEGALRNSGNMVRELNDEVLQLRTALDRASQYYRKLESELICRKISLPSVSDMVKFVAGEHDALRAQTTDVTLLGRLKEMENRATTEPVDRYNIWLAREKLNRLSHDLAVAREENDKHFVILAQHEANRRELNRLGSLIDKLKTDLAAARQEAVEE